MSNTDNAINLLVKLGVDTKPSADNLNSQIERLAENLKELKIDIKIDDKAVKALKELESIDLSKLKDDIKKVGDGLGDSVAKAGKGVGSIGGKVEQSGKQVIKAFSDVQKDIDAVFVNVGDGLRDSIKKGIYDTEELMKAFEGTKAKFSGEYEVVTEKSTGEQIKRVKSIGVEFENLKGQIERLRFSEVKIDTGGKMDELFWIPEKASHFIDDKLKETEKGVARAREELSKLGHEGKLSTEQISKLSEQLSKIENPTGLKKYNDNLQETVRTNQDLVKAAKERYEVEEKIRRLSNQIVASQAKDPKGLGSDPKVSRMLADLEKINPSSARAANSVKKVSDNFERMKAEATSAGRESMTVMDSFRVAMEKFPVWMAASTAFYGTVRGIRDVMGQIVQLDSQITVLRRVAGDGVDANEILKESIALSKELGNTISDVNEGFISFARQGFRGEELSNLAEYATLLGNISDLSVEDSASMLTAGMKGFGIEAENVARIVDSLNEVDNNYSITTLQLAEAMQKSAGSAQTYGVELEKNIGFTTAIGQVTRESGSVIGKFLVAV